MGASKPLKVTTLNRFIKRTLISSFSRATRAMMNDNWWIAFAEWLINEKRTPLIFSWDHCQRFSLLQIPNTPWAGFQHAQNLSLDFNEWSCAVQFLIFKTLTYSLQETVRFDVKTLFESCLTWRLVRRYNKSSGITKEFW